MKVLVIGFGSIGRRHSVVLKELGLDVAILSRRDHASTSVYASLSLALSEFQPDYVVVANKTSEHLKTVERLHQNGFHGRLLIEKPLFCSPAQMSFDGFSQVGVGYNLRFHPLLGRLKLLLHASKQLVTANIYVGSYLPDWRKGVDYRLNYSANRSEGGGVLRDLSHELDYTLWLFGAWKRLTALGGHFSPLEIDADDVCSIIMETENCPLVTIHINYLDRLPKRELTVNTEDHTYRVDLVKNLIATDTIEQSESLDRNATYRAEHMAMIEGNNRVLCSIDEALEILYIIEAVEEASRTHGWIER